MSTSPRSRLLAAAAFAALAGTALAAPGSPAGAAESPTVLAKHLPGPLSLAINDDNVIYFNGSIGADGSKGALFRMAPGKDPKVVYSGKKVHEVEGVSTKGKTTYFLANTDLMKRSPNGDVMKVANLGAYEKNVNPDAQVHYGIADPPAECADGWPEPNPNDPENSAPPVSYTGIVDSHPYGSAVDGGTVYVADAAGNSILKVEGGEISTVAVLEPVSVEITQELADAIGAPAACVGLTYAFEGVPTDVEVGGDGMLYVSSLPGGEGGAGSVLRIDPATGEGDTVLGGLVGGTGVAVADDGDIYATNLFSGDITVLPSDEGAEPLAFAHTSNPAAVEVKGNKLYVTSGVFGPNGKILRYAR
ncbi:ScyD/ScyE family protein [Nocardioides panacisoli]|uniref:ScyD/ScyE family protein n=1 Tax=Nocardioides panacisoli TaxID=627624 RepID=A0ABP7I3K5_9ACTN